jgi:hypothetical protein
LSTSTRHSRTDASSILVCLDEARGRGKEGRVGGGGGRRGYNLHQGDPTPSPVQMLTQYKSKIVNPKASARSATQNGAPRGRGSYLLVHGIPCEHHAAHEGLNVIHLSVGSCPLQRLCHGQVQVQRLRLFPTSLGISLKMLPCHTIPCLMSTLVLTATLVQQPGTLGDCRSMRTDVPHIKEASLRRNQ